MTRLIGKGLSVNTQLTRQLLEQSGMAQNYNATQIPVHEGFPHPYEASPPEYNTLFRQGNNEQHYVTFPSTQVFL